MTFKFAEYKSDIIYYLTMVMMSLALFYNFATGSDIIALAVTFSYCIYIFKCKNDYLLPSMIYMSVFAYLFNYN